MQLLNYFFASVISFLGLLAGILLIIIAPEEQKPLHKYFVLLRKILLLLIFIFALFFYFGYWLNFAAIAACFFILTFIGYKTNDLIKKTAINYAAFGILFFLSSANANLLAIESGLIFLYGMASASILYNKKRKNHFKIFLYGLNYAIIANILFFLRLPFLISYS